MKEKGMKKSKKQHRISWKEWIFLGIAIFLGASGLALLVTGLVGDNMGVALDLNPIKQAEQAMDSAGFHMNFRNLGLVVLAAGALVAIITLLVNAKKSDREHDRRMRRLERLNEVVSEETKEE